ncbi:MAG: hypothetical protein FJZ58_06640 [Chlamydiae bacterium]|nr:hypothetical protein [Chlamydiota bacterium]
MHPILPVFTKTDYQLLLAATGKDKQFLNKNVAEVAEKLFAAIKGTGRNQSGADKRELEILAFDVRKLALEGTHWSRIIRLCSAIWNYCSELRHKGVKDASFTSSAERLFRKIDPETFLQELEYGMNLQLAKILQKPVTLIEKQKFFLCRDQIHATLQLFHSSKKFNVHRLCETIEQALQEVESVITKKKQNSLKGLDLLPSGTRVRFNSDSDSKIPTELRNSRNNLREVILQYGRQRPSSKS